MDNETTVRTGFDLQKDFVPEPLMPACKKFPAKIISVDWKDETKGMLNFSIMLGESHVSHDDGSPVYGKMLFYSINMPMQSHKGQTTKNGKDKFAVFVQMLLNWVKSMKLELNTSEDFDAMVDEAQLTASPIWVDIEQSEYQGVVSNRIKKMYAREEHNSIDDDVVDDSE
jgi:hypothetical protein